MRIKLKTMGLRKVSGILLQAVDRTDAGTDYEAESAGTTVNEIYLQDQSGELRGIDGDIIGQEKRAWIPVSAFENTVTLQREDKLIINDVEYEFLDIALKDFGDHEDHYKILLTEKNT